MHTPEVQHLNQQQSICFHPVSVTVTGNKAALAPCDGKLNGAGESWSFLHSKNCGVKKSAFASDSSPSGAGVMFSTRQLLTKCDSGTITFAGLETPNSSEAVGLLRPVQFTSLNGFYFEVMGSDVSESCSANFKGLRGGHIVGLCF